MVDEVDARACPFFDGDGHGAIALVNQQDAVLAVAGDDRHAIEEGVAVTVEVRRLLDDFVAGAEVPSEEFQSREAGVGEAGFPIDHGDAGELRGVSDQLRFADHVDAHEVEFAEDVGVEGAGEAPVGTGDGLELVAGFALG